VENSKQNNYFIFGESTLIRIEIYLLKVQFFLLGQFYGRKKAVNSMSGNICLNKLNRIVRDGYEYFFIDDRRNHCIVVEE
jgi:hypothetical protein